MVPDLHIIRTEADHIAALAEYEGYFDNEPAHGSREGDRFELLGVLLEKYEADNYPRITAEPREILRLVMGGRGLKQSDFAEVLGSRSRASEIMLGRRTMSLDQIRLVSRAWNIPADLLIGEMADA